MMVGGSMQAAMVAKEAAAAGLANAAASEPSAALTASEQAELQAIANKYSTRIDVVDSRAAGNGRNIVTDLPAGKNVPGGPPTRSDIDFRVGTSHP
jgi:hypothetical protein